MMLRASQALYVSGSFMAALTPCLSLSTNSAGFVLPSVSNEALRALGRRGGADDADNVGFSTVSQNFASALQSEEGDIEPPETISYTRIIEKNDGSMEHIFANNRDWVRESLSEDPDAYRRFAKSQAPKYLYIGCSDSRVPAQNMMGLSTGDLFVVRNVANLCVNTDHSLLAALMYAVQVLEVTDIIVCGHYGCGGVRAAMENEDHGLLEHWLSNIRNVQRLHLDELKKIRNIDQRHKRLVELNVQESCINLFANPIVQKKQASSSTPRIHGWVYDIETGLLNKLEIDFKSEIRKYQDVYRLYEFEMRPTGRKNNGMKARKKSIKSSKETRRKSLKGARADQ